MNDYNNQTIDKMIACQELEKRFNRLTIWQKFIIILWLYGWKPVEIAERIGTSRQNVTNVINQGKRRMGIYYQIEEMRNGKRN